MSLNGVSLAFITETWLNDNIDDAAVHIPNYSVARRDRVSRTGGGVCAFVKSYIPFKVLTELHDDNFETFGYISDHINYFEDFRVL
jgi:DNA-binding GntR family transcriptional regulator